MMVRVLGFVLVFVGAVLVPVGWLYNRNWWVVGTAALVVGCLLVMWQRRRDRETPDTDIHAYSGSRGGPGYARHDGIEDRLGDDD